MTLRELTGMLARMEKDDRVPLWMITALKKAIREKESSLRRLLDDEEKEAFRRGKKNRGEDDDDDRDRDTYLLLMLILMMTMREDDFLRCKNGIGRSRYPRM